MATHRSAQQPRGRWAAIGAAALVLLAAVGFAIHAATSGSGTHQTASTSAVSAADTSSSPTSTSGSPSSGSSSPAASPSAGSGTQILAWAGCTAQLTSGKKLLDATDAAAKSWQMHYSAQLLFDAHKISLATTREMWATSKAAGFGEVKRYSSASDLYHKVGLPCRSLPSSVGASQADAAKRCMAKATAQDAAITAGSKVAAQWADHMHMMTSTMNHGSAAYLGKWHRLVKDAPPLTKAYDQARTRYLKTPDCSAPKV